MTILKYPKEQTNKNKVWVRFKQLDFSLDSDTNKTIIDGTSTDVVYMNLNGSFAFEDGAEYTNRDLGAVGRAIEGGIRNGLAGGIGKDVNKRLSSALDLASTPLVELVQSGQGFVRGEAVDAALSAKVLQRFRAENTSFGAGVRSGLRFTANPHTRAVFNSVNVRGFTFDFNMTPESKEEAEEIKRITLFFRKILYPTIGDAGFGRADLVHNLVYKFPSMLKVDIFYEIDPAISRAVRENPDVIRSLDDQMQALSPEELERGLIRIGPRFLYSYINSVKTNLDPDNTMSWHKDGNPISTSLSIGLTEDRNLLREDIERGY